MSVAYDPSEWHDLFVATAGASAALAGLLFVAVSINVDRIIKYEGLPARGIETLALLLAALIVSIAGLLPGQGHLTLGLELAVIVAALTLTLAKLPITHEIPGEAPSAWLLTRRLVRGSGPILFGIGALSVIAAVGGGLYWVAAGIVFATLGAVANAWVLLVEILR